MVWMPLVSAVHTITVTHGYADYRALRRRRLRSSTSTLPELESTMQTNEIGMRLRACRKEIGERRGRNFTLMAAAAEIAEEAARQGIGVSRMVPRTHASLTRWELGNVQPSLEGLRIIARTYGVSLSDLVSP